MKRFVMTGLLVFGVVSLLWSAGTAEESNQITLYTSVPQNIIDEIQTDFMEQHPEVELEVFRAGTGEVLSKIATERQGGEVLADLIWVADPSTYESFKDQDLLLQFTPEEASALAPGMADDDGYYYAGRLINMIIGYNTEVVDTPPETWTDLLSEQYNGRKAMASPVTSGAALAAAYGIGEKYGPSYFEEFKANNGVQASSNGAVRDALSTQEYETGIVLDYMMRSRIEEGSPVDYVWPEDGAVFIPSPIGIINTSDNIDTAKVFVDYALSQQGQQTLVELGSFIPVRDDVAPPDGAPALSEINALTVDWVELSEQADTVRDSWSELFEQ